MFCKLLVVIACLGATACGLLSARHQRIEAARDSIRLHAQLDELRQGEWTLDLQIANRVRPEALHDALADVGEIWSPIVGEEAVETPTAIASR